MSNTDPANDDATDDGLEASARLRSHLAALEAMARAGLNAAMFDMGYIEQDRSVCARILAKQALLRLTVADGPEATRNYVNLVLAVGGRPF